MKKIIACIFLILTVLLITVFPVSAEAVKSGDVDRNGSVGSGDLVELRKVLLGVVSGKDRKECDTNGDGTVDIRDLIHLKRYLADQTELDDHELDIDVNP